jgi:hypothetical protein
MSKEIERRLEKLEEVAAIAEPRVFHFPFGDFTSLAEVNEHPAMGAFVEAKRQEVLKDYAEKLKLNPQSDKEKEI